jgi:hypothetical protein
VSRGSAYRTRSEPSDQISAYQTPLTSPVLPKPRLDASNPSLASHADAFASSSIPFTSSSIKRSHLLLPAAARPLRNPTAAAACLHAQPHRRRRSPPPTRRPPQHRIPAPKSAILRNPRGRPADWAYRRRRGAVLASRPSLLLPSGSSSPPCFETLAGWGRVEAAAGERGLAPPSDRPPCHPVLASVPLPHRLLSVLPLHLGARAEVYSSSSSESAPPSRGGADLDMLNSALQKVFFLPYCSPLAWLL